MGSLRLRRSVPRRCAIRRRGGDSVRGRLATAGPSARLVFRTGAVPTVRGAVSPDGAGAGPGAAAAFARGRRGAVGTVSRAVASNIGAEAAAVTARFGAETAPLPAAAATEANPLVARSWSRAAT